MTCHSHKVPLALLLFFCKFGVHQIGPQRVLRPFDKIVARVQQIPVLENKYPADLWHDIKVLLVIPRQRMEPRSSTPLVFALSVRFRFVEIEVESVVRNLFPAGSDIAPVTVS